MRYLILLLLSSASVAQVSLHPPESTVANFPTCNGSYAGSKVRVATDGASATDCVTGAGSTTVVCWCDSVGPWARLGGGGPGDALDTELIFNNAGTLDGSVLTTDGTDITLASGHFRAPNGTTSLPSYSFSGNPDTGVLVSGDQMWFVTDSTTGNYMYLQSSPENLMLNGNLQIYTGTTGNYSSYRSWDGGEGMGFPDATSTDLYANSARVLHTGTSLTPAAAPLNTMDDGTTHRVSVEMATGNVGNAFQVRDFSGNEDFAVTSGGITLATIPHGEMYAADSATTLTLTTISTWYKWQDATCGNTAGMTCSTTTDDLIVDTGMGGAYVCVWNMGFILDTNNQVIKATLSVNGTEDLSCGNHRKVGTGADVGSTSGHCILDLAAADAVTLEIQNATAGGVVITPEHVSVVCKRVGA